MKRAQVAVEWLFVLAIATFLFFSVLSLSSAYLNNYKGSLTVKQTEDLIDDLARAVKDVYLQGMPARLVMEISMPAGVEDISFEGQEITFIVNLRGSEIVLDKAVGINMTGDISTIRGRKAVIIEAHNDFVNISG